MTQYLLNVMMGANGPDLSPEEMQQSGADVDALNEKMIEQGVRVFANGLHPFAEAKVVRRSGGKVIVTDGPYIETREQAGGFWIIEESNLDAALDWARQATVACRLPIEVREIHGE